MQHIIYKEYKLKQKINKDNKLGKTGLFKDQAIVYICFASLWKTKFLFANGKTL